MPLIYEVINNSNLLHFSLEAAQARHAAIYQERALAGRMREAIGFCK
jgi:hypothetical protein